MEWVRIGKVGKSHGLKGAFVVQEHSGVESALGYTHKVWIGPNSNQLSEFIVASVHWSDSQGWRLQLTGWQDPETVRSRMHQSIWIPREALKETGPNEYYESDLIGFQVKDRQTGALLGQFESVEPVPGTADRWWIRFGAQTFAVLAMKEFVDDIDWEAKTIWLKNRDRLP